MATTNTNETVAASRDGRINNSAECRKEAGMERLTREQVDAKLLTGEKLTRAIARAAKREENDDHLEDDERTLIVESYRAEHLTETLPMNMTDAYVEIVFG